MGTYWDDFLKQYPFVRHCALETTLELFYFYCDRENQDLFKEKEKRVREQFNAPPVSNNEALELCDGVAFANYIEEKWKQYRTITNNEDAWCFKQWLVGK